MSLARMKEARDLIVQKEYEQARAILVDIDHSTARDWLAKIDKILGSPESHKRYKQCPFCAETILYEAQKCRFCGSDLNPNSHRALMQSQRDLELRTLYTALDSVNAQIRQGEQHLYALDDKNSGTSWGGFIIGFLLLFLCVPWNLTLIILLVLIPIALIFGGTAKGKSSNNSARNNQLRYLMELDNRRKQIHTRISHLNSTVY